MNAHPESGNALWFILLSIALLAALSVTISRTSDTTEQSGDVERQRIQASDILRYSGGLEKTIEQMRLRGISENEISFQNGLTVADYTNARCGRADCLLFDAEGGGSVYRDMPAAINTGDWIFSGANNVTSIGTADADLVMILPDVDQSVCNRLNAELDISGIPQDTDEINIGTIYTGNFENAPETIDPLAGKRAGCFQGDTDENSVPISDKYYFYQVLIPR